MTISTYPSQGGTTDNTTAAAFIPELWSDEIVAAYKRSLVMGDLVSRMPMMGKKGDTIHVPKPSRGSAYAKLENTAVTIQNETASHIDIIIDRHFEYSKFIEDITDVQALSSMRKFYTDDAGYALSTQVDNDLFYLGTALGDGTLVEYEDRTVEGDDWVNDATFYNNVTTGLTEFAPDTVTPADVFTDAAFRGLVQKMDDANVPMDGRKFSIPPSLRNAIMGIDRYVSSDFVNGKGVNTGLIGQLYGVDIYVTSNAPVAEDAASNPAAGVDLRVATMFHTDTFVFAEQMGVRSQTQYKQEWLADLYTADQLYGKQVMRTDAGFNLIVPN